MRSFSRSYVFWILLFATGGAQACGSFTTAYRFDLARQVVGVISPADGTVREAVRNTYDSEGRIIKVERGVLTACPSEDVLPRDWQNFDVRHVVDKVYDVMGRLMSEKSSGAALTQYSYDSVGRLECTAVRMNSAVYGSIATLPACQLSTQGSQGPDRITRLIYDVAGRVVTEQRAYGTSLQQSYVTYAHTPNGRQDWVEDANGNRTDLTYDGFDRLSRMNFPQATLGAHAASSTDYEAYGYDNNSNLTSKRLRSAETITYGFDALNRLETKTLAGTSTVSYTYDNFGLNESAQISGGAGISNVFDGFGRLTQATSSSSTGSLTLTYRYDEDGNRTRVTWPDGTYVQYTYDGRNRMKQARENGAVVAPGLLADYSYDVFGRPTNIARGNGTATAFDYDAAWHLLSLRQDLASTSRDLDLSFSYNSAGQLTQRGLSNDAYAYFSTTQTRGYAPDGRNRYTTVGGISYGYDGRGNLTSDGSRTFSYDLENHLLSVSGGGNAVSLTYDPNGRLLTSTSGGVSTRYLYDGDKLVAEYNGSTLVRRYVHGAGVDEALVWYEGTGLADRRWLHADHQGSVVATSDGVGAGTVYAYSAYGEPAYGNWVGSRFRYTGQIVLPEAKLYHYKARVYDPVLGRFLQTDPVGYEDDFNLYAYVRNDPMNLSDPTGLAPPGCGGGADAACPPPPVLEPKSTAGQVAVAAEAAGNTADVQGAVADAARGAIDAAGGSAPASTVAPALTAMRGLKSAADALGPVGDGLAVVKVGAQLADGDRRGAAVTVGEEVAEKALTVGGGALAGGLGAAAGYGLAQTPVGKALGQLTGTAYDNGASAAREVAPTPGRLLSIGRDPSRRLGEP